MNWPSWQAFWSMGGYGVYVWGSYAVVAAAIFVEVVQLRRARRAAVVAGRSVPRGGGSRNGAER